MVMAKYKSGFDWLMPDVKVVIAEYLEANGVECDLSGEFDEEMAERVHGVMPDIPASYWIDYSERLAELNAPA